MGNFLSAVFDWFATVLRQFTMFGLSDALDILIVSVILYFVYKFIKDRRAGKLTGGLLLLGGVLIVAELFEFQTLRYIFANIFQVGLIAIVIIFQPELRAALEKVGGESLKGIAGIKTKASNSENFEIDELCSAVFDLSSTKTGALIVLENTTKLGDIVKSGVVINSDVVAPLVKNIFYNKAPLHDGAMVIRDMRILAAGCFLPLTESSELSKDLGTRHRAAVGMSEASDAKVIVVSEETGIVSVAYNGKLRRRYDIETLKNELIAFYSPSANESRTNGKKRKRNSR